MQIPSTLTLEREVEALTAFEGGRLILGSMNEAHSLAKNVPHPGVPNTRVVVRDFGVCEILEMPGPGIGRSTV